MEALSRQKATFEACNGLFRQLNMKTLGRELRRVGMWKLRCRLRRTDYLIVTIYEYKILGFPTILRVLSFAISRGRANFCDFAQPKGKAFNFEA